MVGVGVVVAVGVAIVVVVGVAVGVVVVVAVAVVVGMKQMIPHRVIIADPAWLFADKLPHGGAEDHYKCISLNAIYNLANFSVDPLEIMGQPIANNAVLFLWRVAAMQRQALDVVRRWGFNEAEREIVWLKKTSNGNRWFGLGRITRAEHEVCLIATRGKPEVLNHSVRSTFVTDFEGLSAKVGRHSEKPEEFYKIIETLFAGPYLELFARKQRIGWTCIGDQL